MVYHGPKAMEELVRYDPHLVVGILGGSAGTTRDAFQLLHDAQKYGAKVALFGRKINNAENQLAFVHFLRLIVDGQIGPVDAVRAYHAVLAKLGIRPHRRLEDDLQLTDQAMSYAGTSRTAVVPRRTSRRRALPIATPHGTQRSAASPRTAARRAAATRTSRRNAANGVAPVRMQAAGRHGITAWRLAPYPVSAMRPLRFSSNGRPDFTRMSPAERLAYHRERLGLGR